MTDEKVFYRIRRVFYRNGFCRTTSSAAEGERMAEVTDSWPDPEVPDFDSAGRMVPPWVKYPNLPSGSAGWRMGQGESYWLNLQKWWRQQSEDVREAVRVAHPPPPTWSKLYIALG